MDIEQLIFEYIHPFFVGDGMLIAVCAFVVGAIIKNCIDFIDNKYIPLICGLLGIVLGVSMSNTFSGDPLIVCGIKGLVLAWAATGGHQFVQNMIYSNNK